MKITKRLKINKKIFSHSDLKRIATIFEHQSISAKENNYHFSVEYKIHFLDETSIEGDSDAIMDDTLIEIKRPVKIEYRFNNYSLSNSMSISISHGNDGYGNEFIISSNDSAWLNDNFSKITDFINSVKPQSFFLIKYSRIFKHLLAIGVGSLGILMIELIVNLLMPENTSISASTREIFKPIAEIVNAMGSFSYILGWFWRWICGWTWGTYFIANYILTAWPEIELDFGAEHLKREKQRRRRLYLGFSLIILPILINLVQDFIIGTI